MLEDYFGLPDDVKMKDIRPELHYQVGTTPGCIELPRSARDESCLEFVKSLGYDDKPLDFTNKDPKWRFFWRIGDIPASTNYPQLNAEPVVPSVPNWSQGMNHWGKILEQAVNDASKVVALGLGLPIDTFSYLAKFGPHLLAPTGSDLTKYGTIGTVLAGFHTDMNLLTIHGKSRFAGLSIWTPSGKKLLVKIPDGCLLIQAGKQMEILTGGKVKAGFHEVTIVPETQSAIAKQIQLNRPLWRISSTLFFHVASDNYLEPLLHFSNKASIKDYPKITAGDQVRKELEFINLAK